jgi:hypothetical protein
MGVPPVRQAPARLGPHTPVTSDSTDRRGLLSLRTSSVGSSTWVGGRQMTAIRRTVSTLNRSQPVKHRLRHGRRRQRQRSATHRWAVDVIAITCGKDASVRDVAQRAPCFPVDGAGCVGKVGA